MDDAVIDALRRAVSMSPDDAALRLHLADLLLKAGRAGEAVQHCALVLAEEPAHAGALSLLTRASDPAGSAPPDAPAPPAPGPRGSASGTFDWQRAEADLNGPAPAFTTTGDVPAPPEEVWDVEASPLTLNDVGGMAEAKRAIELQFLGPLRHPELREAFGKSPGGGLLMYGPPGCGKSFIARAIAGEMGAAFLNVTVADVLDMYVGVSESNMHELFLMARRRAPIVLFFDELDAIGMRRHADRGSQATRNTTVQLLTELDGVGADIAGVCEQATEAALAESTRTGRVRTITMRDLQRALGRARPSCGAWFSRARNIVTYANNDGEYDDLRRYMAARKLL